MATDTPLHQGTGIYASPVFANGLMPLQADVTVPQTTSLSTGTSMLVTDKSVAEQLRHFPEEVYDLRPTSHLVRLMQVLLGDAGVGQLRKRLLTTQIETLSTSGARFFDLDRFYGAIFNAQRTDDEQLPINPMEQATATAEEWESIETSDASFRDRMTALAQAIAMGGTLPGLQAAAEAVSGAECDVFESWAMIEAAGNTSQAGHAWSWLEGETWQSLEGEIWGALEGIPFYGRSGSLTRSEVIVRVHRDYPVTSEGRAQRSSDQWALVRVLERLKPAHILLTVDNQGASAMLARPIAAMTSDSEHWEMATKVTPNQVSSDSSPYPLSAQQAAAGIAAGDARVLPRPPMSSRLGDEWSYGGQLPSSQTYGFMPTDDVDFTEPGAIPDTASATLDQTVIWRDSTSTTYGSPLGLLDPLQSLVARASADGVLVANPYSGDRRLVPTAD